MAGNKLAYKRVRLGSASALTKSNEFRLSGVKSQRVKYGSYSAWNDLDLVSS
jgi:hypothetical protein